MANLEIYNFDHVVSFPIFEPLSITFLAKQLVNSIAGSTYLRCQRFHPFWKSLLKKERIEDLDLPNAKLCLLYFYLLASANGTNFAHKKFSRIWFDFASFPFPIGFPGSR